MRKDGHYDRILKSGEIFYDLKALKDSDVEFKNYYEKKVKEDSKEFQLGYNPSQVN